MLIIKLTEFFRIFLTTILVYTFGYLLTIFLLLIGLTAAILKLYSFFFSLTLVWSYGLFTLTCKKLYISGKTNMENNRPYLIVSNHSSFFDIVAIMAIQPNISWVAREYLFNIPIFGYLIRKLGCIPVERKNFIRSGKQIIFAGNCRIKNQSIGIFPEGTRTLDGKPLKFKRGFIRIFRYFRMDILPVTLNGFFSLRPKNRFTIHPKKKLEIIIHKPITYSDYKHQSDEKIMNAVTQSVLKDYKGE